MERQRITQDYAGKDCKHNFHQTKKQEHCVELPRTENIREQSYHYLKYAPLVILYNLGCGSWTLNRVCHRTGSPINYLTFLGMRPVGDVSDLNQPRNESITATFIFVGQPPTAVSKTMLCSTVPCVQRTNDRQANAETKRTQETKSDQNDGRKEKVEGRTDLSRNRAMQLCFVSFFAAAHSVLSCRRSSAGMDDARHFFLQKQLSSNQCRMVIAACLLLSMKKGPCWGSSGCKSFCGGVLLYLHRIIRYPHFEG